MSYRTGLTLDDRLRFVLRRLVAGTISVEEARIALRGEVLASFYDGQQKGARNTDALLRNTSLARRR